MSSESIYNTNNNLLAANQCLVYIENRRNFADVKGVTYIANIIKNYIRGDTLWYDLILETDMDGDKAIKNGTNKITVTADKIVSNRSFHDIEPREIYHFSSLTFSSNIEYPIEARSFVIKSNIDKPLESTSRSALGSGIYGIYVKDKETLSSLLVEPNQSLYLIPCPNAYPIQDKEHGESLTIASINTNRYLDNIIQSLRENLSLNFETALVRIQINESPNLLTLWNIVLHRTRDMITQETLNNLFAQYVVDYLEELEVENSKTSMKLIDSINGEVIYELPINYIMKALGYNGIIASDIYNNGWNRGCVNYDYLQLLKYNTSSPIGIIRGETARY